MDRMRSLRVPLFVTVIVGMGCFTGLVGPWMKWRRHAELRAERTVRRDSRRSRATRALDGSVDTMAVEVERISEAQRFTARILAERSPAPAQPPEPQRPAWLRRRRTKRRSSYYGLSPGV